MFLKWGLGKDKIFNFSEVLQGIGKEKITQIIKIAQEKRSN